MSIRIFRIILALIIVGLISALFLLNPQETTVYFGKAREYRAPMALVLILTFVAGAVFAAILALIAQFRLSFINWREKRLRKIQREHLKELVHVRELVALEKWEEARSSLSRILKEDPDNAVARALLATSTDALEGSRAALRILEEGRGREIVSAEVYLIAAELQEREGNLTAALDNLALLLQRDPSSKKVLREAVRISAALGDYPRAVECQEKLARISDRKEYVEVQNKLAELELEAALRLPNGEQDTALDQILRRHRHFPDALLAKAKRAENRGELDAAGRDLIQAFAASGSIRYLQELSQLWIRKEDPERAVKFLRNALKENDVPAGRAFLAALLSSLGMLDQAEKELSQLRIEGAEPGTEALVALTKAKTLQAKGASGEAVQTLAHALSRSMDGNSDTEFSKTIRELKDLGTIKNKSKEQLAPQFSTP